MTAEQKAYLENQDKIIADLRRQLNERKGIQTSQPSAQPNSAVTTTGTTPQDNYLSGQWEINQKKAQQQPQPTQPQESYWSAQYARQQQQEQSEIPHVTGYPKIDAKIANGTPLTYKEIAGLKYLGFDINKLNADLNVRKTSINKDIEELKEISNALRASEIVLSMLNDESGKANDFGRMVNRWSKGFYPLNDNERQWVNAADNFRRTLDKFAWGNQLSNKKEEISIEKNGIGQRFSTIGENVGILRDGMEMLLNHAASIMKSAKLKGLNLSDKDLGIITKRLQNAQENIKYMRSKEPELLEQSKFKVDIGSNMYDFQLVN